MLDVGNSVNAATLTVTNGLTLNGTALVGNPTNTWYGEIGFAGTTPTLSGNGTVVFGNNGSYSRNALRVLNGGTTLAIGPGITVRGQNGVIGYASAYGGPTNVAVASLGTISADVSGGTITVSAQPFSNQGLVAASPGTVSINNGFGSSGGTLLFGLASASSYGRVNISGPATLGGNLSVVYLGGFAPALSNSFSLITYGSHTGAFSNLSLPPFALWQTAYGATSFVLLAADIDKLVFMTPPAGANAGSSLSPVVVQIQDSITGHPIATNGIPVTISLASGKGTLSGTLTQLTDPTGKATFSNLSVNLVGSKTLRASAPAITATTSSSFTISPAAPAQLALLTSTPSPQIANRAFSPPPVIQVLDQFGNPVPTSTSPITARLSSSGGGSLGGTTTVNVNGTSGSASFTNLVYTLAKPALDESIVLYFASPGLASATSSPVSVDFVFGLITLTNGNSLVEIDPTTQDGVFSWTVDGTNQLYQHWFWLREGSSGPQNSFDMLGTPLGLAYTSNSAILNYLAPGLSATVAFNLSGGNAGTLASDLTEAVTIQNTTNVSMTLHVFDYSDFDLADADTGDTVAVNGTNVMVQEGKGMMATETVQTPMPNYWEASWYAITLDKIDGGTPITLSDQLLPQETGDQTFAFQWDATLGAGQSLVISLSKSIKRDLRMRPMVTNLSESITPMPVPLTIALSGPTVLISWPTNGAAGFQLQSAGALRAEAGWAAVPNPPIVVGHQYQASLPLVEPVQFYRLQK